MSARLSTCAGGAELKLPTPPGIAASTRLLGSFKFLATKATAAAVCAFESAFESSRAGRRASPARPSLVRVVEQHRKPGVDRGPTAGQGQG